jgi:hypothetical protein
MSHDSHVPNDPEHLLEVLHRLETIVAEQGHTDKATWLSERRRALQRDPHSTQIRAELHAVVLGMGGLIDLPLRDVAMSAEPDALADEMYQLTKP